jgi:hypothetical protein
MHARTRVVRAPPRLQNAAQRTLLHRLTRLGPLALCDECALKLCCGERRSAAERKKYDGESAPVRHYCVRNSTAPAWRSREPHTKKLRTIPRGPLGCVLSHQSWRGVSTAHKSLRWDALRRACPHSSAHALGHATSPRDDGIRTGVWPRAARQREPHPSLPAIQAAAARRTLPAHAARAPRGLRALHVLFLGSDRISARVASGAPRDAPMRLRCRSSVSEGVRTRAALAAARGASVTSLEAVCPADKPRGRGQQIDDGALGLRAASRGPRPHSRRRSPHRQGR